MAIQKRMHTIDDVREMQRQSGIADRHYELIEGELIEMSPANLLHAWLASNDIEAIGQLLGRARPRSHLC